MSGEYCKATTLTVAQARQRVCSLVLDIGPDFPRPKGPHSDSDEDDVDDISNAEDPEAAQQQRKDRRAGVACTERRLTGRLQESKSVIGTPLRPWTTLHCQHACRPLTSGEHLPPGD